MVHVGCYLGMWLLAVILFVFLGIWRHRALQAERLLDIILEEILKKEGYR